MLVVWGGKVHSLMGAAGVIVILVTLYDVVRTTLGMQGGGPPTERLPKGLWSGALEGHRAAAYHAPSEHAERRKLLVALVRTDGWTWRDVRET